MSEPNWQALDNILRPVDQLILNEATSRNIPVGRRNHTMWRWDAPESSIRWTNDDGIGRNVVGYVDGIYGDYKVKIECNAWIDPPREQRHDPNQTRKWEHEEVAWIDPSAQQLLQQAIKDAFDTVMSWTIDDLSRANTIPPAPVDPISIGQTEARRASEERENQARLNAIANRLVLKED